MARKRGHSARQNSGAEVSCPFSTTWLYALPCCPLLASPRAAAAVAGPVQHLLYLDCSFLNKSHVFVAGYSALIFRLVAVSLAKISSALRTETANDRFHRAHNRRGWVILNERRDVRAVFSGDAFQPGRNRRNSLRAGSAELLEVCLARPDRHRDLGEGFWLGQGAAWPHQS